MLQEQNLALQEAARETILRVNEDLARSSSAVRPLIIHIREHLFEVGYDATALKQAFQLREWKDNMDFLRAEVGHSATGYIALARLETASRLLRDTTLSIGSISVLVGYSDSPAFRVAFKRCFGLRPQEFRKLCCQVADETGWPKEELLSIRLYKRIQFSDVEPIAARNIIAWLKSSYARREVHVYLPRRRCEEYFQQRLSEEIWEELAPQPPENQKRIVRDEFRFASTTLFHLLGEKSVEHGRDDRQFGIHLAKLALDLLEANPVAFGEALADLRALGWARVANAQRLAQDFIGAEKSFSRADDEWEKPRSRSCRRVEAEICALKATLRLFQRRFIEAFALLDRAIGLCREYGPPKLLAKALIQRAKLHDFRQEHDDAVADLREAIQILQSLEDSYLQLVAHNNLATSYTWAGKYHKALEILRNANTLCEGIGNRVIHHQLEWIEGLVMHGLGELARAESLLRNAQVGFTVLDESHYAAAVSIDLAILYDQQGHHSAVPDLAVTAIRFFEAYKIRPDAIAARDLLHSAVEANAVTAEVLVEARKCRDSINRDPTAAPCV